ncbi:MAG TPA: MucR family transcriptional regulator [Allosphingosinicella sp.]
MESKQLIELTADIVAAHVSNNPVPAGDVGNLIVRVHEALCAIGQTPAEAPPEPRKAAVSVRASLKPDYLVCMECGQKQKTLKRHLVVAHQLTPDQYRSEYDLPQSYPMTAPNYSATRRELAHRTGLGRKKSGSNKKRKSLAFPAASRKRGPKT